MKQRKKLRVRRCLVCDQEFSSFANWICPKCHQSHYQLFHHGLSPNEEDLIYLIDAPDHGSDGNPSPLEGEGTDGVNLEKGNFEGKKRRFDGD